MSDRLRVVYVARYAIPELDVARGDVVVIEPMHPTDPFLVVKRHGRAGMRLALGHVEGARR